MQDYPNPWPIPSTMVPAPFAPVWEMEGDAGPMPVGLAAVKDFLGIPREDVFFDLEKTSMLHVALSEIEQKCQLSLRITPWVGYFPGFTDPMRINRRPLIEISRIEYVEAETGAVKVLDKSAYLVERGPQMVGIISRADGVPWPATARRQDAVRVYAKAGFASLPQAVQHAILLTIASIDRNRGDSASSGGGRSTVFALKHPELMGAASIIPNEAKALLAPYKLKTLGI